MGPQGSNGDFRRGSLGQRTVAASWILAAGTAILLSSCTATGPLATGSLATDEVATDEVARNLAAPPITTALTAGGDKLAAVPANETPPTTMLASYMCPVPAETPIAKPAAENSPQPEQSSSPSNLREPTLLQAAVQASVEAASFDVPALTVPASGATAEQSIAGVLQYAMQHHPLLRVRRGEIEAARAKIVTARLLPNPELTVDTLDSSAEPGAPELNTRLMFTLPIGPKRELRTAAAASGVCQAQLAMSRDTKLILAEAADAAVEVLYLQELCVLYGQLSGLANQVVGIQTERFNVAAVPYRNVVLTELSASKLELMRQNAAAQLDQAKVRLARAVGATDGTPPPVNGHLAVEPIAFAPVAAMQARVRQVAPELAESRTVIEKSREELSLEQWKAVPDLKIGPRYQE